MKEIHHCFTVHQWKEFMPTICFMCIDKNEGIHLHVHVGVLFALKWVFFVFLSWDYQG
jgi:hypothetical protein